MLNIELNTATILGFVSAISMAAVIVIVANYVLSSIGYSRIALRRNISGGWTSWVPIIRCWIVGAISDHYDNRSGIKRRMRVFLLITQIIQFAIIVPTMIFAIQLFIYLQPYGFEVLTYGNNAILLVPFVLAGLGILIVNSIYKLCYTVAMFKLFESTVPQKALVFAIIGALIPLVNSIFVFISRNSGFDYFTDYPDEEDEDEDEVNEVETVVIGE